ncbi:ATP-dependent DNA helicase [Frankliniella fusca]|uniref:ATP-dependent DNA helicase n=1 Tax=Frankliniella fusca TaxID=407009 RepID=A0AAE1LDU7_9NEOP|nr:ATP-dependent DNA helicase [Frankliniella fusca]
MIDKRCKEATGNYEEPFGGLCMMFLGDLKQLPPVLDAAVYSDHFRTQMSIYGIEIFRSFQKKFVPKTCFRQDNNEFLNVLDNLSNGIFTTNDYKIISSRFSHLKNKKELNEFKDAFRLFAGKDERTKNKKNKNRTTIANEPLLRIQAQHNCDAAKSESTEAAEGLQMQLYLAKGCKIILKNNLWVHWKNKGLVNETIDFIHDILFEEGNDPRIEAPTILLCSFPSYTGPEFIPGTKIVPIQAILKSWINEKGILYTRYQFPISLAYACTIHKAQGMTLEKAVVDIGPREFAGGLAYVAFSRVRKLEDILIEPFPHSRLQKLKYTKKQQIHYDFIQKFCEV